MGKLQMIKRANGTLSFSVNIPLSIIEDVRWEKGTMLTVRLASDKNEIIISEEGK